MTLRHKSAVAAHRSGSYAVALSWLTKADRLLEQLPHAHTKGRIAAELEVERATVRHWQGRPLEAIRACDRAVAHAEAAGAMDAVADALVWRDVCELTLGRGDGAAAARALEIWRGLGDRPWHEARTHNELGIRAYFAGRWDEAREHYEEAQRLWERAGDLWSASVASGNAAEILSDQGHLDRAEPLLREGLRVWRASGARLYVAFGESQLGRLAARAGRHAEAMSLLTSARDRFAADGEQIEVVEVETRLAECLLLAGRPREALAAATDAIMHADSQPGVAAQLPLLHRIRGGALAALGAEAEALDAYDASLAAARQREARHEVAFTLHALAELLRRAGRPVPSPLDAERDELFAALGIIAVPVGATTVELPQQRDGEAPTVTPSAGRA